MAIHVHVAGKQEVNSDTYLFSHFIPETIEPGEYLEDSVCLADDDIGQVGKVEMYLGGVWGAVCESGLDRMDAHTLCEQYNLGDVGQTGSF